jgi:hypothetical protein
VVGNHVDTTTNTDSSGSGGVIDPFAGTNVNNGNNGVVDNTDPTIIDNTNNDNNPTPNQPPADGIK